jgi:hypothetical protein
MCDVEHVKGRTDPSEVLGFDMEFHPVSIYYYTMKPGQCVCVCCAQCVHGVGLVYESHLYTHTGKTVIARAIRLKWVNKERKQFRLYELMVNTDWKGECGVV